MIDMILDFKEKLEEVQNIATHEMDRSIISEMLIMLNISEMAIRNNVKISTNDRYYFERQALIGRYFADWGKMWIADDYLKLTAFIKAEYWN